MSPTATFQPRQMVSLSRSILPFASACLSKAVDGIKVGFALQIRQGLGTFGVQFVNWRSQGQVPSRFAQRKGGKGGRGRFSQSDASCGFQLRTVRNHPITNVDSHPNGIVGEGPLLQSQCQEPKRLPNHTFANRQLRTPNTHNHRRSYSFLWCPQVSYSN